MNIISYEEFLEYRFNSKLKEQYGENLQELPFATDEEKRKIIEGEVETVAESLKQIRDIENLINQSWLSRIRL